MTKPAGYLTNSLTGLQGETGVFYDYVLAENGLFLKAKNANIDACVCIAPQLVRGLAPCTESIKLVHGKIPLHLLQLALSVMVANSTIEQYIAFLWNEGYTLKIPTQEQSPGAVTYENLPGKVLDLHSHVGKIPNEFSSIDDHDEQGFCVYGVAGHMDSLCPLVTLRLGIYGYFVYIEQSEIFA